MTQRNVALFFSLSAALTFLVPMAAPTQTTQINARTTIYLTYDDGPDAHTLELAQYLNERRDDISDPPAITKTPSHRFRPIPQTSASANTPERPKRTTGIRATFFVNMCRLSTDEDHPSPWSGNCTPWPGKQNPDILAQLVRLGHELGNHTMDHVQLTNSALTPTDWESQFAPEQKRLDRYQGLFHAFRAPYLSWNATLDAFVKGDPYLSKMTGPFGCDYCGGGTIDGQVVGGDWDCFAKGFSAEACGGLYVSAANYLSQWHDQIILLFHDRLQGNEGTEKALLLAKYVIPRLSREAYDFQPLSNYYAARQVQ